MKVRGDFLGPPRSTDITTLIIKNFKNDHFGRLDDAILLVYEAI